MSALGSGHGLQATLAGLSSTIAAAIRSSPKADGGTTYTPVLSDEGRLVMLTYAGAIDVTLPADGDLAFPVGGRIDFGAFGVGGAITFVQGAGATVNGAPTLVTEGRYHGATAFKTAADAWWVVGALAAA